MYKNKKTGMLGIVITILLLIAIVFVSNYCSTFYVLNDRKVIA